MHHHQQHAHHAYQNPFRKCEENVTRRNNVTRSQTRAHDPRPRARPLTRRARASREPRRDPGPDADRDPRARPEALDREDT